MTLDQGLAFAIVIGMMALFAWGRLRYDLVALLALFVAVVVGIVPPSNAPNDIGISSEDGDVFVRRASWNAIGISMASAPIFFTKADSRATVPARTITCCVGVTK